MPKLFLPLVVLLAALPFTREALAAPAPETIPALLLSDIHFDPFHDPAKVPQLVSAPVEQWAAILSAAPSPDREQAYTALQRACSARLPDTSYTLLQSSLHAIQTNAAASRFVTISGDLLAHQFDCRYKTLVHTTDTASYVAFIEKTIHFLMLQLQATLPGTPIYIAMGNNDSACGDYRMNLNDQFLASTAKIVASGIPSPRERTQALHDFAATGEYAVTLPSTVPHTRLLVIDDIFLSKKYSNCDGHPDPTAVAAQLAWLQGQLASARQQHQRVWVLGHIPPGIDIYSTYSKLKNPCDGAPITTFLSSEKLADLLFHYSDTIKLALFGHTHMDELRFFHPEGSASQSIPIKMVASISPVDGNIPSFTMASINPVTATIIDYQVITASNSTGIDATWSKEYDYDEAYHQHDLSAASLAQLVDHFQTDATASTPESKTYVANYFPGDASSLIKPLWPQYVCSVTHNTAQGFAACACPEKP